MKELNTLNNDNFLCFVCGIICCEYCSSQITKCPQCRTELNLKLSEKLKHFSGLLKRSNYKYLFFAQYLIGLNFFEEKNYSSALYWFESAAILNYNLAQYMLGYMALKGYAIEKNHCLAIEWFRLAQRNNYTQAKVVLAYFYWKGLFFDKDVNMASRLLLSAAKEDNVLAQNNIACIYNDNKDLKKAFKWFKKAASNDCVFSKYMLALYYENGYGCWKNKNKALKIYKNLAFNYTQNNYKHNIQNDIIKEIIVDSQFY